MRRHSGTSGTHDEDLKRKVSGDAVKRLLQLAVPYRGTLTVAAVLTLFGTALSLCLPILIRQTVNRVIGSRSVAELDRDAAAIIALIVVAALFGYLRYVVAAVAGNGIVRDLRQKLFAHLQRLPVAYFDKTRSGDLTSYLSNDVSQLQLSLTDDLVSFAGNLIQAGGGVAIAVWMNPRLTLVVVVLMFAMMAFFVTVGRKLRQLNRNALDALADTMGGITEALANIRLVKAFARERHEDSRTGGKLNDVMRLFVKSSKLEGLMGAVGLAGMFLLMVGVMWVGAREMLHGMTTAGDLSGFAAVAFVMLPPMSQLAALYTRLQRAVGAGERIFAILDTDPEAPDAPNAVGFPQGAGEVVFDSVEFRYVPDVPVLTGLNLRMPAGKVTAVVGPSGAGKSTLASLLYRFYEPNSGSIEIDGVRVDQIRRNDLREHVGIVPQEPILFNGTIRDNIRYGRLDATDAEIEAAARDANVEEFVKALPEGYETVLGERGITLSGGQRQRVAIARAVLKNPKILVLDEATSALDTKSEALVKEALDRLMAGRTTLVIAHRLSTVQHADQIAVVADGKVSEVGTHAELLRNGGKYAELYEFVGA